MSSNKELENNSPAAGDVNQEIIDLVIARLKTMPSDATLTVGGREDLTLSEVIEDVREQNDLGREVVREQMDYLHSLKDLLADGVG